MSKPQPVPKLDLAPKLKRPLSLFNPLDYLRLLYWVFYFPQALGWYEKKWGGTETIRDCETWGERIKFLRQYPQLFNLWLQGIILTITTPLLLARFLELLGIDIGWLSVAGGVAVIISSFRLEDWLLGGFTGNYGFPNLVKARLASRDWEY